MSGFAPEPGGKRPRSERRVHDRTPLELPVRIVIAGRPEALTVTANVSPGGLFVKTAEAPPVGTRVKFVLDLGHCAVRGHAEVAWIRLRRGAGVGPPGMGLRIVFLLDDGRERFESFLASAEGGGA